MKYYLLVCEGLAAEPSDELGGRTPLEVAKTPFMDELAQKGKVGVGAFAPASLPASADVALFSLLGYDPLEFYTGLAPLEALAMGVDLNDRDVAFRCDMVTVADGKMMDAAAGKITSGEAATLFKDLKPKVEIGSWKLYPGEGHRSILVSGSADKTEEMDEAECTPPKAVLGQKISSFLPKGKAKQELLDMMSATKAVLDNHEVNRVRIDLKENPASQCWLWGQGKKPKLSPFKQKNGLEAGFFSTLNFVKGLALAAGFEAYKDFSAMGAKPFSLFYKGRPDAPAGSKEVMNAIKHIEEFDSQAVGPLVKKLSASKDAWRLAVASARKRQHAPLLIAGTGIESGGASSFNEKNCAQSGVLFDPGHSWLAEFLKK